MLSPAQLEAVWSTLLAGGEFTVRNQDGSWGLRGTARGVVAWSRAPFEQDAPERCIDAAELSALLGGWDFAAVSARLTAAPTRDEG